MKIAPSQPVIHVYCHENTGECAVEEHIKEQVDQRMEEMETRMSGKLDAIFALLQNSQKPS